MSQIECRIGCTHVESIPCSKIAAWKALEKAAQTVVELADFEDDDDTLMDIHPLLFLQEALEAAKHG